MIRMAIRPNHSPFVDLTKIQYTRDDEPTIFCINIKDLNRPRANRAKGRFGRKPGASVTNFARLIQAGQGKRRAIAIEKVRQ